MPIGGRFTDQFKPGDVIYGFSGARSRYFNCLSLDFMDQLTNVGQYLTINEYNYDTFGSPDSPEKRGDINFNLYKNASRSDLTLSRKARLEDYYQALAANKYAPIRAVMMGMTQVKAKGNDNVANLVFRRASKFGLQYLMEQLKVTVHFALDHPQVMGKSLNFRDIVIKKRYPGCDDDWLVPVTMSELRCCYRNRHWTRLGRLKFYVNFGEVPTPWDIDPVLWATYDEYRNNKYNGAAPLPPRAERPPLPLKPAHLRGSRMQD